MTAILITHQVNLSHTITLCAHISDLKSESNVDRRFPAQPTTLRRPLDLGLNSLMVVAEIKFWVSLDIQQPGFCQ